MYLTIKPNFLKTLIKLTIKKHQKNIRQAGIPEERIVKGLNLYADFITKKNGSYHPVNEFLLMTVNQEDKELMDILFYSLSDSIEMSSKI